LNVIHGIYVCPDPDDPRLTVNLSGIDRFGSAIPRRGEFPAPAQGSRE
jgi:hypothetical protein